MRWPSPAFWLKTGACTVVQFGIEGGQVEIKATLVGEAAHICAASPGGPRYDPSMSDEERRSHDNGIWLCANCATEIDKDPARFPVSLLRRWKEEAESGTVGEIRNREKTKKRKKEKQQQQNETDRRKRRREAKGQFAQRLALLALEEKPVGFGARTGSKQGP